MNQQLNEVYGQLAAQLGDITFQIHLLTTEQKKLLAVLEQLNKKAANGQTKAQESTPESGG